MFRGASKAAGGPAITCRFLGTVLVLAILGLVIFLVMRAMRDRRNL